MGSVAHDPDGKKDLAKDVHMLARSGVQLEDSPRQVSMVYNNFKLS